MKNDKEFKIVRQQLVHCQYPQNWRLREQLGPSTERTKENTALLMEDAELWENELPFHSLMTCVALAYEYFVSGDIDEALEILRDCETKFEALAENPNIHDLTPAFSHLLKAMKVDFLLRKGDAEEAAKIDVQEFTKMDYSNRVALRFGFPALFLGGFGSLDGVRLALNYLSKAIKDDPTESVWYYTKAEYIGQLERGERLIDKMPSDEEFQLLEKAMELKPMAIYASLAGNLYRQSAKELTRPVSILGSRCQGDELKIKRFNEKAYNLYCESIKLNPNCVETVFRCARGFVLLPPPYRDLPRAKELLDKGMGLAPRSRFGNRVMAEFMKGNFVSSPRSFTVAALSCRNMKNDKEIKIIREQLLHCQYPQNWQLREQLGPSAKQTKESTALFMEDAGALWENELPFHSLMTCVALAYEYFVSGDIDEALEILRDCETKFEALAENPNIHDLTPAFSHLLKAMKVDLLLRKGDAEEAAKIDVQEFTKMDYSNRVALRFGFPALFLGGFGSLDGVRLALNYLSKAIKDDPTESVWYYTKAEYIGQLDRGERSIDKMPSDEEFQLLETAMELKPTAIYASLAGNLYRLSAKELARPVRILGSRCQGDELKIKRFNEKAYNLFCESIELNPNCMETVFRCARGFVLLPPPYRDLPRAKELLDRGMGLAPRSRFGNRVIPKFLKGNFESSRRSFKIAVLSCRNRKNNELVKIIRKQLLHCQYPQNWRLREQLGSSTERTKQNIALLMEDAALWENELPFHSLMTCVALAYEYFVSGDIDQALEALRDCESKFEALAANPNIRDLTPAFSHLLKAMKVDLLLRKGDSEEAAKIDVQEFIEMDYSNRVALRFGFPALFLGGFGSLDGLRLALNYLSKAIKDDPTESVWYYTKAEYIGQLDRGERLIDKMPGDEEFQLLEKAMVLKRTAIYYSLAGNLYRQSAKELTRPVRILGSRCQGDELKIKRFNEQAYYLYCESIKLNPNCMETVFRCARGFVLLPPPYRNLPRAKELLDRGMGLAPRSRFGNRVMAEFLKGNDPLLALQYYAVCADKKIYGATMAKIRLEYQLGLVQDYIKIHEDLLQVYESKLDQVQILNELTTYCILVLKDMRRACEYADKMLEFGRIGDFAMQCRPSGAFCTTGFSKVTLYELLINEIKRLPIEGAPEERRYFLRFLKRLASRKIASADPERKEDKVTFSRASSNFSFYRISNDSWRSSNQSQEGGTSPGASSSQPVFSWRRQTTGPPTGRQLKGSVKVFEPRGYVRTVRVDCGEDLTNQMRDMDLNSDPEERSSNTPLLDEEAS